MPQSAEDVNAMLAELAPLAVQYGLTLLGAIAVLIIGLWVAGTLKKLVANSLRRVSGMDEMLVGFLSSLVKYLVYVVTAIVLLGQFGIETTSVIALLGAAGLAIGLALQGTLSNVAAGVMLLIFRPFKVGDFVEVAGQAGTVKSVSLFVTELATPDNVQIVAPNGDVWGSAVMNYSFHDTRRVDLVMGIGYGEDINKAMATFKTEIGKDTRILKDPEPFMAVSNLGDSSVDITVRVWVANADYWGVKFDLTKAFKEALDANGIDIPFPTRTLVQAPSNA